MKGEGETILHAKSTGHRARGEIYRCLTGVAGRDNLAVTTVIASNMTAISGQEFLKILYRNVLFHSRVSPMTDSFPVGGLPRNVPWTAKLSKPFLQAIAGLITGPNAPS